MRTCAAALQREEEKALQVIRQAAKNGETQGCRNIAAAVVNSRKVSRRLQTVKFRLDSVEINLQQQRCTGAVPARYRKSPLWQRSRVRVRVRVSLPLTPTI